MKIFVDSSVILAFLAGQDKRAYRIIEEIENHIVTGYINAIVIDEIIYGYLRIATELSSKKNKTITSKKERETHKANQK